MATVLGLQKTGHTKKSLSGPLKQARKILAGRPLHTAKDYPSERALVSATEFVEVRAIVIKAGVLKARIKRKGAQRLADVNVLSKNGKACIVVYEKQHDTYHLVWLE